MKPVEAIHADTAKLRTEIIALYKKHLALVEELPKEEDVKEKRAELDEQYPFEPVEEFAASEEAEEAVVDAAGDGPTVVMEEDVVVRSEPTHARSEKFDQLKFGDNYDV